jgi:hypothetical protein
MTNAQGHTFDQPPAIDRNRDALLRIVAVLFAYAGLDEGGADEVPRRVWRRILRLLRPAEAAARRLIVIAARGIEVAPPKPRPEKEPTGIERLMAAGVLTFREVNFGLARAWSEPQAPTAPEKSAPRVRAFPLTDPPRRFDTRAWDGKRPFPQDGFDLLDPDEEVSARHLCRRILSLKAALDDLPRHARRLARREARLALAPAGNGQRLAAYEKKSPQLKGANQRQTLRRGHPPGRRRKPTHRVDDILSECHALAVQALKPPDTS